MQANSIISIQQLSKTYASGFHAGKTGLPLQAFPEIRRRHTQLNELPAWRGPFPALRVAAAA